MVSATAELVLITTALVAALYALGFVLVRRLQNATKFQTFHLMRPLIVPTESTALHRRLDAALRDAEDGFRVCDVCSFENLKRNIFCSLCGSVLETAIASETNLVTSGEPHAQQLRGSASTSLRRQARALKRKEWRRKVDSEGKLHWVHELPSTQEGRGYVVLFAGEPLAVDVPTPSEADEPQPESEPHLTRDPSHGESEHADPAVEVPGNKTPQHSVVVDMPTVEGVDGGEQPVREPHGKPKPRLVLRSLGEVSQLLESELASRPLTLDDPLKMDPTRSAVVFQGGSAFSEDPAALVHSAGLDFPSKLAEFVTRTSAAVMASDQSFLKTNFSRNKLLENSIEALAAMPSCFARCPMRVAFTGEQGVDAGGVHREWLEMLCHQLASPAAGIFRCVDAQDRSFYLNPTSHRDIGAHHLAHFFATGRLLGRMMLEGNVTGFHLALPLLKIIVGQPVSFSDLEYFDPEVFKSLSWLLENDGVDVLGLDFTVAEQTAQGEMIVVDLVPNGSQLDVTDANKHEYVDLKFKHLLFGGVQNQLFAFLKGLYEVMPPELLMLFDAEELDLVLSGSDEIDVDDWQRHTKSTIDLVEHPVLGWFWDLVREMPNEYRRRLLLFSTGSSRVPLAGFASLTSFDERLCPFMLKGVSVDVEGGYIRSHACFNQLELPRFFKKSDLKAVLYAVLETEMYGFTSA